MCLLEFRLEVAVPVGRLQDHNGRLGALVSHVEVHFIRDVLAPDALAEELVVDLVS